MLSQDQFSIRWQRSHHFPMDLSGDTAFYHEVYDQLKGLVAGRNVGSDEETCLFRLLLYTENCVAIGLDNVYERMYRRLGDAVAYWCERMGARGREASRVHDCLSRAVANAPESSLRQWLKESILSHDFHRLREVALFFARYDHTLRVVYPILRYRAVPSARGWRQDDSRTDALGGLGFQLARQIRTHTPQPAGGTL